MPKPKKEESDDDSIPEDDDFAGFSSDDEIGSEDFDEEFGDDCDEEEDDDISHQEQNAEEKPKISKHLLQLREKLGLDDLVQRKSIETVQEKLKQQKEKSSKPEPLVVVYNDPSKRKKKRLQNGTPKVSWINGQDDDEEPTDLIKTKHEVKRFAMQGMKSKTKGKEEARTQLLVSLGAVAPKQKPVNYKDLKAQKAKELARAKRLKEADNIFASKIQSMVKKNKEKKRDKNKVTNFDANFGKVTKKTRKGKKGRK